MKSIFINPEQRKVLKAFKEYLNHATFNHESGMSSADLVDNIHMHFSRYTPADIMAITLGFYQVSPPYPIGTFVVYGTLKDVGRVIGYGEDYSTCRIKDKKQSIGTSSIRREAHPEEIQMAIYQEQLKNLNPSKDDIVILSNGHVCTYGDICNKIGPPIIGLFNREDMFSISTYLEQYSDESEEDEIIPELKPTTKPRRVKDFNPVPKPLPNTSTKAFNKEYTGEFIPHEADTTED